MSARTKNIVAWIILVFSGTLAMAGLWMRHGANPPMLMKRSPRPAIMSTGFQLTIVVPPAQAEFVDTICNAADDAARVVETQMNIHDPASPLSKFNSAPAGQPVELSTATREVLMRAKKLWLQSDGAFDVTARPVFMLWKKCGLENRLPSQAEIIAAREKSQWQDIEITDAGVNKTRDTAGVDLGGIAKGLAIDLAAEAMIKAGATGGVVDIGGDVRCFGEKPDKEPWLVAINDPFTSRDSEPICILALRDRAVCTSGNYERFSIIGGRKFSHIVNPRTGMPADLYPSVTVIARNAVTADAWATALSVLGPAGFDILPKDEDIEAMIVLGSAEHPELRKTPGFDQYVSE